MANYTGHIWVLVNLKVGATLCNRTRAQALLYVACLFMGECVRFRSALRDRILPTSVSTVPRCRGHVLVDLNSQELIDDQRSLSHE